MYILFFKVDSSKLLAFFSYALGLALTIKIKNY